LKEKEEEEKKSTIYVKYSIIFIKKKTSYKGHNHLLRQAFINVVSQVFINVFHVT